MYLFPQASHATTQKEQAKTSSKNMSTFFISPSQYIRIFLYLPSKNNLKSTKRSKALHIYLRLSPFFGSNNLTMNCFLPRTTLLLLLHCTATATAAAAADVPAVLLPSILLFSFRLDFCKEERNYTTRKRSWHLSLIHISEPTRPY